MNRVFTVLIAVLLLLLSKRNSFSSPGVGDKLSISVTNKFGDVFTNLTVTEILADGLVLGNQAGQMKVKYKDLPAAVGQKYQPLAAANAGKKTAEGAATTAFLNRVQNLQTEQSEWRAKELANEDPDGSVPIQLFIINVPGQDWKITLLNPGLKGMEKKQNGDEFMLQGLPGTNGCVVSVFVEPAPTEGVSNEEVFNYFWSQMADKSLLDTNSVRIEKTDRFFAIGYTVQGQPNENFYFAYKDRWVDVHMSKPSLEPGDEKLFGQFEAQLAYGE